jgi:UDP-3-O-[3-hydroxymyristoyl] glucosamine N-acyltransferase
MNEPFFFTSTQSLTIGEIAALTGAEAGPDVPLDRIIANIATIDAAGSRDLAFFDNPRYLSGLVECHAGACLIAPRFHNKAPPHLALLTTSDPYGAFVKVARALFDDSLRPRPLFGGEGIDGSVHPAARLESGVTVEPGAVIGAAAEIGAGTLIAANAAIGSQVRIGRNSSIGPQASITHALIGDRVIIHAGCRIGQDGFGFVMGASGHLKVPQLGRVIIQDDVEIGAGTAIDRGANRDTVIGEGTKIDNLVQIGHNVVIGRHCIIVAQTGISGSVTLEDFVVLGARVGINNHVTIGEGAQIAAISVVGHDVPPGVRWGGVPAKPARQWMREMFALERLAARHDKERRPGGTERRGGGT